MVAKGGIRVSREMRFAPPMLLKVGRVGQVTRMGACQPTNSEYVLNGIPVPGKTGTQPCNGGGGNNNGNGNA